EADLAVAIIPNMGKISLIQMDGLLTKEEFEKAIGLAIQACKQIYELQKAALKQRYSSEEKVTEEVK
ncbi:MAG: exosome complex exonuclease Rrp41, partial [Candidatus Bathyarchaeota archaeon]